MYIPPPFTEADLNLPLPVLKEKTEKLSRKWYEENKRIIEEIKQKLNSYDFFKSMVTNDVLKKIDLLHGKDYLKYLTSNVDDNPYDRVIKQCSKTFSEMFLGKQIGNPKLGEDYSVKEYTLFGIFCKLMGQDAVTLKKISLNVARTDIANLNKKMDIDFVRNMYFTYVKTQEMQLKREQQVLYSKEFKNAIVSVFKEYTTLESVVYHIDRYELIIAGKDIRPRNVVAYYVSSIL